MSRSIGRRWAGRLVAVISIAAVSVVTGGTRASAAPAPLLPPTPDMVSADALADGADRRRGVVAGSRRQHGVRRRPVQQRPAGRCGARHQPDAARQPARLRHHEPATWSRRSRRASTARCSEWRRRRTAPASTSSATSRRPTARLGVGSPPTARRTGALITEFNPVGVNSQARAVVATNDTVYVGGGFQGAGRSARAGTWSPSAPRTARSWTGTRTPTTRCGRWRSPPTDRRSSPAARSRTSAVSRTTAWPRSTRPPVR